MPEIENNNNITTKKKKRANPAKRRKKIDPNAYAEVYVSSPFTSKVKRPQRKWAKDIKPEKPKRTQTRPQSPKLGVVDLAKARELDLKKKKKLETEIERKKSEIVRSMEKDENRKVEQRSKARITTASKNSPSPFGHSQLEEQEAIIEKRRLERLALEKSRRKKRKEYMYMRSIEFETRLASAVQEEIVRQEKEQARIDRDKRLKMDLDYEESDNEFEDAGDEFEPLM
eukprot:TRINITY_DN3143_c1_g3_i1.p1 TRINITY_DN3143_c1_g3~~TRINITY_DN3143_c1_g3_i1.p1  ORF type:complete len:255 (+),score=95.08 TRINITY_DN3143_c1_g3_i1:82-765(+)